MALARSIRTIGFWTFVFAGILASQYLSDAFRGRRDVSPPLVIPAVVIRAADLGLHSAAASFLWVGAIQRFTALARWRLAGFAEHISIINGVDPKFSYPYAFAVLVLPSVERVDEAIQIGERGIAHADPDWQIPYYLALAYHVYLKDRVRATEYLQVAARTRGAPDNVRYVAETYGNRQDLRQETRDIWQTIYENSKDEIAQEQARNYILHLDTLDFLEQAVESFRKQTGTYPQSLDALVTRRILKKIPQSPWGFPYEIQENGTVTAKFETR